MSATYSGFPNTGTEENDNDSSGLIDEWIVDDF
jgi:hypothetical protein